MPKSGEIVSVFEAAQYVLNHDRELSYRIGENWLKAFWRNGRIVVEVRSKVDRKKHASGGIEYLWALQDTIEFGASSFPCQESCFMKRAMERS